MDGLKRLNIPFSPTSSVYPNASCDVNASRTLLRTHFGGGGNAFRIPPSAGSEKPTAAGGIAHLFLP